MRCGRQPLEIEDRARIRRPPGEDRIGRPGEDSGAVRGDQRLDVETAAERHQPVRARVVLAGVGAGHRGRPRPIVCVHPGQSTSVSRPALYYAPWPGAPEPSRRAGHRLGALPFSHFGGRGVGGLFARPSAPAADHAALAPRLAGLLGVEFVCRPLLMSRLAPLRGDLALTLSIHPREATSAALALFAATAMTVSFPAEPRPRRCPERLLRTKLRTVPPRRQGGGGDLSRTEGGSGGTPRAHPERSLSSRQLVGIQLDDARDRGRASGRRRVADSEDGDPVLDVTSDQRVEQPDVGRLAPETEMILKWIGAPEAGSLASKTAPASILVPAGKTLRAISLTGRESSVPNASAGRDLSLALVARLQPLQPFLQAGQHLAVAVHVAKWPRTCRRFDHRPAFDLELVRQLHAASTRDLHPARVMPPSRVVEACF